MRSFSPDDCYEGEPHDWQPDPERRGEGYACTECGATEAELFGEPEFPDPEPHWER